MKMTGDEAYRWLMADATSTGYDVFDRHVVASILAIAVEEAGDHPDGVSKGCGLNPDHILSLIAMLFPLRRDAMETLIGTRRRVVDAEEQSVRDILLMYASSGSDLELGLAAMVARRCQAPHHLWQDLGLQNRGELSHLMQRYFTRLAKRNQSDMKWKKFLYRMVCGSEGFSLCTTPVCSDCSDFDICFGDESGESLLAHVKNIPADTCNSMS